MIFNFQEKHQYSLQITEIKKQHNLREKSNIAKHNLNKIKKKILDI